ncbi:MAG: orotidine-5'-phosphate decarboxylase [Deltaproteobacteria bacterium]|nr:orotidine-5'-phosphate decarboxylase [Deltaproteobacteria bacterium]
MEKVIEAFSDRLLAQIDSKKSFVVAGLDPEYLKIPIVFRKKHARKFGNTLTAVGKSIVAFNKCIIDIVAPLVPCVKPQIAFYEMYGLEGLKAFVDTVAYAKKRGLIVIEDAKRNDIGHTARAYSNGHLGMVDLGSAPEQPIFDVDSITVNPYLGSDSISPFLKSIEKYGKGIFVLVKTSNPSSVDIQDLVLREGNIRLFEHVATLVHEWGKGSIGSRGYSSVGAVVGATFPQHATNLRKMMPQALFLVPGYGAQGASGKDVVNCFNKDGYGGLISASRSINYVHGNDLNISKDSFKNFVRTAVDNMNNDINKSLMVKGLLPW